jgi:hypothetical protein
MAARRFRIVRDGYVSRETAQTIATTKNLLRNLDVRAMAVVLITPGGTVHTVLSGHRDGHYHTLNSGIATLRTRFDRECE